MKPRTTLILLVICIVGIVAVYYESKYGKTTEQRETYEKKVFPDFKQDSVTNIKIQRDSTELAFSKKDGKWFLDTPISDRADESPLKSILSDIEFLEKVGEPITAKPNESVNLDQYGLTKPRGKLIFSTGKETRSVAIGGPAMGTGGMEDNVYIYTDDNPKSVFVVSKSLYTDISKEINDFRDKKVTDIDRDKISKIELTKGDKSILCEKKDKKWLLVMPIADRANPDTLKEIVDKVADLKKESFVKDGVKDFAEYGLDKPAYKLAFWQEAKDAALEILIGKKSDSNLYATTRGTGSVYTIKDEIISKIDKEPKEFRDKRVERFEENEITEIAVTSGDASLAIHRDNKDEDWKLIKPVQSAADKEEARELLSTLGKIEIEDWVEKPGDLAEYGLDKPLTVTLTEGGKIEKEDKDKKPTPTAAVKKTILFGKAKDDKVRYAKRADESYIFTVKSEGLEPLSKGYLAFLAKEIFEFSTSDVKKFTVERDGRVFSLKKEGDTWNLLTPVPAPAKADKTNVDDILSELDSLDAQEFVSDKTADLAPYSLDKPAIKVYLTVEKEETEKGEKKKVTKELTLLVGAKQKDNRYYACDKGGKYDGKYIFTIASSEHDALLKELRDCTVADFTTDDATSLTLTYPDQRIVCEKKDGDWKITEPTGREPDSTKIKNVVDALHYLRCERYAEYDAKDLVPYGLDKPQLTVTCKVKNKEDVILHIGAQKDDKYYARKADLKEVFVLDKSKVSDLMKKLDDLSKKPETKEEAKPAEKKEETKEDKKDKTPAEQPGK